MNLEKYFYVKIVDVSLDMQPTDKEIEKVLRLVKEYSKLKIPEQQRINMFDFIRENWNG
jgi:uncharacterized protein YlxP (DUF503 family)